MKNVIALSMVLILLTLTSCELAGDIFGAGFYTGLIVVFLVIAIIIFVVARINRRR
jgi:hypothetical protein